MKRRCGTRFGVVTSDVGVVRGVVRQEIYLDVHEGRLECEHVVIFVPYLHELLHTNTQIVVTSAHRVVTNVSHDSVLHLQTAAAIPRLVMLLPC